jgi:hypothetical protein
MSMPLDDLLGWVASLLTLITFAQTNMVPLRVTAILANVFFIAYGAMGHCLPVLTLHAVLLPLNSLRLAGAAKMAFMTKCCEDSEGGSDGKKLSGEARANFVDKCAPAHERLRSLMRWQTRGSHQAVQSRRRVPVAADRDAGRAG